MGKYVYIYIYIYKKYTCIYIYIYMYCLLSILNSQMMYASGSPNLMTYLPRNDTEGQSRRGWTATKARESAGRGNIQTSGGCMATLKRAEARGYTKQGEAHWRYGDNRESRSRGYTNQGERWGGTALTKRSRCRIQWPRKWDPSKQNGQRVFEETIHGFSKIIIWQQKELKI